MYKSLLLTSSILLFSVLSYAQVPGKKNKNPFEAVDGFVYSIGDTLTMGKGSNPDGSFNFIYVPSNAFLAKDKVTYSSAAQGIKFPVKHFSTMKNSGKTFAVFTYVPEKKYDVGLMNAIVDINLALESGELVSKNPEYFKDEPTTAIAEDKYSKLKELKKLLDEGILTQEEFDSEKQKILK